MSTFVFYTPVLCVIEKIKTLKVKVQHLLLQHNNFSCLIHFLSLLRKEQITPRYFVNDYARFVCVLCKYHWILGVLRNWEIHKITKSCMYVWSYWSDEHEKFWSTGNDVSWQISRFGLLNIDISIAIKFHGYLIDYRGTHFLLKRRRQNSLFPFLR